MIELTVKQFLDGHLSVPSFFESPGDSNDSYVLIEKTGSSGQNRLRTATIAFQSYAASLLEAAKLNEEVKGVVGDLITEDDIRFIRLNSDYNYTDTTTKKYRYQAVFDIGYY